MNEENTTHFVCMARVSRVWMVVSGYVVWMYPFFVYLHFCDAHAQPEEVYSKDNPEPGSMDFGTVCMAEDDEPRSRSATEGATADFLQAVRCLGRVYLVTSKAIHITVLVLSWYTLDPPQILRVALSTA